MRTLHSAREPLRAAPAEIVALTQAMGARSILFETRFAAVADRVCAALPQVRAFVAIGDARRTSKSKSTTSSIST